MRKDLFDQLVASVTQMKAIQAGRLKPGRVTRGLNPKIREITRNKTSTATRLPTIRNSGFMLHLALVGDASLDWP